MDTHYAATPIDREDDRAPAYDAPTNRRKDLLYDKRLDDLFPNEISRIIRWT